MPLRPTLRLAFQVSVSCVLLLLLDGSRGGYFVSSFSSFSVPSRSSCASSSLRLSTTVSASSLVVDDDDELGPLSSLGDSESEGPSMPWSEVQEWALDDNISKFTVLIPPSVGRGRAMKYVLWRTLAREVPELAGYNISFLRKKYSNKKGDSLDGDIPGVLAMVDDFEFAPNGGIAGRAYGLPGIADGTRIQTPPLVGVETTVLQGYVTSQEMEMEEQGGASSSSSFSYELGVCASSYSLDGTDRSAALLSARRLIMESGSKLAGKAAAKAAASAEIVGMAKSAAVSGSGLLSDQEANQDLLYLGGATAMLIASASAIGMLSHHLTVNVWVI